MRAVVFREPKVPMKIEELWIDDPAPAEAIVRVVTSGLCHSDLHFIDGVFPSFGGAMVLGHEIAGIVEKVGSSVTAVKPGDRVIAAFVQPCGFCSFCESGEGHLCQVGGATRDRDDPRLKLGDEPIGQMASLGAFAEYLLTPASGLVKVADDISLDVAALVGCGVMTGLGAVTNTAKVEPGSTVAVIGTGGVGLNVIQGAQLAGARQIIAVDLLEHKLAYARKFGATDTVDASGGDAVQQVLDISGGGVDYAFEAIGLGETARQAFDMTRRGGTAVIVGMIAPGIDIPIPGLAMLSEKKLIGSFYGSSRIHKDMPHILELAQSGKIDLEGLITKRYDKLEDVNIGFDALRNGEVARSVIQVSAE